MNSPGGGYTHTHTHKHRHIQTFMDKSNFKKSGARRLAAGARKPVRDQRNGAQVLLDNENKS